MIDRFVELIQPLFESWGYLIVGGGAFFENSIGLGLLVPGETLVLLGGFYAAEGSLRAVGVAVAAFGGGTVGDTIGYVIGRTAGRRLLDMPRLGRLLGGRRLAQAERYYARHGGKTVFLGRFIPVLRSMGPFLAGTSGLGFGRFTGYNVAGAALWASGITLIGFLIGSGYGYAREVLGGVGALALLILVVLVAGSAIRRRRRAALKESAETPIHRDDERG